MMHFDSSQRIHLDHLHSVDSIQRLINMRHQPPSLRPQNTANHEMQIKYFVYVMERASYLTDKAGLDKMCWVLDCPGYSMKTAPPMKTSMETLRIMQDHYPERLGEAICYKPPTLWTVSRGRDEHFERSFVLPILSQFCPTCKNTFRDRRRCDCVYRALIAPSQMFWRMIKPFVDPVTVAKVCMATDAEADRLVRPPFP